MFYGLGFRLKLHRRVCVSTRPLKTSAQKLDSNATNESFIRISLLPDCGIPPARATSLTCIKRLNLNRLL